MKQNKLYAIVIMSLVAPIAPIAKAMPPEYQVNAREGCRQAVAGAYLKIYDERERSTAYKASLQEQVEALKPAIAAADGRAKAAAKALAGNDFDADLASARDDTATVVRTLTSQLGDYHELIAKNEARIGAATAEEKRLRAAIDRVFLFERTNDLKDGGYPVRVSYRSPCPKYRALCPLPVKDSEALSELRIDGELPEACRRYIGQGRIP